MIRAVVHNGFIQPLEPLPTTWQECHEVLVNEVGEQLASGEEDFDRWSEDMDRLTRELYEPTEWLEIEAALAEADRQSKDFPGNEEVRLRTFPSRYDVSRAGAADESRPCY
jgi:hypothetical protein